MPPRRMAVHPQHLEGVLLLNDLTGYEAISRPFHFQLQCIAENNKKVPFEALLGQPISIQIQLPNGSPRWISGLCSKATQGGRDRLHTNYVLEVVPEFWFLSRDLHSLIFQHMTVSEILEEVLHFKHTKLTILSKGKGFEEPREFCVQYRESDFAFASRLMEEEGYHYYFKHDGKWQLEMIVSNGEFSETLKPESKLTFDPVRGGTRHEDRVLTWEKSQELKACRVILWDHHFQLPHKHLEARQDIQPSVKAGQSTHSLYNYSASKLEQVRMDWPGGYAKRFDGVTKAGAEQPERLQKIFEDNLRTTELRMQEEAAASVLVSGSSNVRHMVSGSTFTLDGHFDGNGPWVLYEVEHVASESADVRSGRGGFKYRNHFTCFPVALPFRPPRVTPRPVVPGTQTAVVVGPKGEELFTDKYGRVKVQFHWDPWGKNDLNSSCWIRVGQPIAGRRWGASFWPRIGQEVIVDFLEGDPDRPIIIGCVYNADQMPPYLGDGPDPKHKNDNRLMGIKSSTTLEGEGFNEWRFDDTKGKEQLFLHAARNMDVRVKSNSMESVGGSKHLTVGGEKDGKKWGDYDELIYGHKSTRVRGETYFHSEGSVALTVGHGEAEAGGTLYLQVEKHKAETIGGDNHIHADGEQRIHVTGDASFEAEGKRQEKVGTSYALDAGQEIHLKGGSKVIIEAAAQVSLKVGGNFVDISPAGVAIQGTMVLINSGGAPGSGSGSQPQKPGIAKLAPRYDPSPADHAKTGFKSSPS